MLKTDKINYNLVDISFSHHTKVGLPDCSVAGRESEFINWVRHNIHENNVTFYSNECVIDVFKKEIIKEKTYGMMFESRAIIGGYYNKISNHLNKFEKFFTHNSEFLKNNKNCYWIPGGGIWIGGNYGGGTMGIHEKKKLCSIISSNKRMCELHNFRLTVVENLKNNKNVEIFGLNKWTPIYETLEDFMFSIVIENFQDELYFTEKLLNCFATGTIPIYLGAKKIHEKFNEKGILCFSNMEELNSILNTINKDLYFEKLKYVKENFQTCQEYKTIENFIFKNYI